MPTSFLIFLLLPHPTYTYPISAHATQHRYPIALFVLLNVCDAISDPSTFICLPKSQPNQTSHLTVPPPLSYAELHNWCDQILWTADRQAKGTRLPDGSSQLLLLVNCCVFAFSA